MKGKLVQNYFLILFLIKKACFAGRPYVTCRFHQNFTPVLDILVRHGFIRSYDYRDNGQIVVIWTRGSHSLNGAYFSSITDVRRIPHYKRNSLSVSCQLLKRLTRNDGSALYILNTDRGLMSHIDAIRLNIGGNILFRIA